MTILLRHRAHRLFPVCAAGAIAIGIAVAPALVGCSSPASPAPTATAQAAPLSWMAPSASAAIRVGDVVELGVAVAHPDARAVRFVVDGRDLATCDPSLDAERDCRRGELFRATTTFDRKGTHTLVATFLSASGETVTAETSIDVLDRDPADLSAADNEALSPSPFPMTPEELAALEAEDAEAPPVPDPDFSPDTKSIGVRDPNRGYHDIFGGIRWAVKSDRVLVSHPPAGSVSLVTSCMHRYGASIRKWADHYKLSRATVVGTAIAESSCTNPSGSSDGLSSGPLQVTASTCASLTGLSPSTCRVRMHTHPDFSFEVGAKYMATSYQVHQHHHDPPKIAAAYNAGSLQPTTANRWHMVVTGNHIDRWVGGYNAYRSWETKNHVAIAEADPVFEGASVMTEDALPASAAEGAVVFVGDFENRNGDFAEFRSGRWIMNGSRE